MSTNAYSLLDEMKEIWGQTFEELNNSERLWLISSIVGTMTADVTAYYNPNEIDDCITIATERFNELSFKEQLDLASALINQIKSNLTKR